MSESRPDHSSSRYFVALLIQTTVSFVALVAAIVYLYVYSEYPYDGLAFLVLPALAVLVVAINTVALLLGLPLRLVSSLRRWWFTRPLPSIVGLLIAVSLLGLAWLTAEEVTRPNPEFPEWSDTYLEYNDYFYWIGLVALAFSLCNFWIPQRRATSAGTTRLPWISLGGIALGLVLIAVGYLTSTWVTLSDGPPDVDPTRFDANWAVIVPGMLLVGLCVCTLIVGFALRPDKPVRSDSGPVDR